ncbi:aspartyl/glutamyl-tRNA(Asn/Gln) amidotransferase subunit A [Methanocella conradii HZ254]|uniref:Glutamyl-tRNA(Gln) amidotransferase subunit A n=1 Tax=Methanocella conradii (strain DSM 24694 / JCM 17849 / CGMCC 1.5162 / HZ254) TaxID=1041930 RepID=H8I9Y2_METCZ|nr:Asp-tRNA(Asn)/Glu-tRNA(Gln) amidotransferase subunit GatA [Methanocella conradii]AFD00942.1 aspartyl/glutamyl-tRNA(Asn/Gln) amidotransferase subunit A [Methanocella conradii HZ254]
MPGQYEESLHKTFDRIKRSRLNAYITLNVEDAIKTAKAVDEGRVTGRLAGVPVAVKDCITTKGLLTTCGSKILSGYVPPFDAEVVARLKREGAVIVGKTNMDEFAMGTSTESSYYGPTRNPWDLSRVPGGSSGGSGAAVAGLECRMALGTDTGGSVRCPASFCGIVGIKPTYGLVSRYGVVAYANSLEQVGPMARNVSDAALLLDVIAGHDPKDSTSVDTADKVSYVNYLIDDVKGLKIGVPKEYFGEGTDKRVENAVWSAIMRLNKLGADYREVSLPHTKYALAAYYIIAMCEASSNLARFDGLRYGLRTGKDENWHTTFSRIRAEGFGEEVKRRIMLGTYALSEGYYGKYYLKALKVRTLIKQDFDKAFKDVDILAAPTMPFPAFRIGEHVDDPLSMYMADVNTVPVNLAGVPSISVPCGFAGNLPIGIQFIGGLFDEPKLIRTAYTFELNTDFQKLPEGF